MKNIVILTLILLFSGHFSYSQYGHYQDKRDEIKKQQLFFISQELQLTDKEKKEFLPVYAEYDKKREELHDQKRTLMHNFMMNNLNMSNEQMTEVADKLIDCETQAALISKEYHEKFKKVLPPLKIIMLYHAENEFKKMVLKQAHGGKHP
jgi:isochorismate hydrolase